VVTNQKFGVKPEGTNTAHSKAKVHGGTQENRAEQTTKREVSKPVDDERKKSSYDTHEKLGRQKVTIYIMQKMKVRRPTILAKTRTVQSQNKFGGASGSSPETAHGCQGVVL
jgi:hypothetical protein